jgi:heme A synthase
VAAPDQSGRSGGARPDRPLDVTKAFALWLASVAVSLVGQLIAYPAASGMIREAVERGAESSGSPIPPADVETIMRVGLAIGLALIVLLAAVWVLVGFKLRAGRNWARVLVAAVTVVGVVSMLATADGFSSLPTILTLVQNLLAIAVVVYLYRPESSTYFSKPKPGPQRSDW